MKTLLTVLDDKTLYANAAGWTLTLSTANEMVRLIGGIAIAIYTIIRIQKLLSGKSEDWCLTSQMD